MANFPFRFRAICKKPFLTKSEKSQKNRFFAILTPFRAEIRIFCRHRKDGEENFAWSMSPRIFEFRAGKWSKIDFSKTRKKIPFSNNSKNRLPTRSITSIEFWDIFRLYRVVAIIFSNSRPLRLYETPKTGVLKRFFAINFRNIKVWIFSLFSSSRASKITPRAGVSR